MEKKLTNIIDKLTNTRDLSDEELKHLLDFPEDSFPGAVDIALRDNADYVRRTIYGDEVYIRGLIEFTNYCRNNCYYCGIRRDNSNVERYRLSKSDILSCCMEGYKLGFRTFVLQGGEDFYYSDDVICFIVHAIKQTFNDVAVTLSIGERSRESYQAYFDVGADRYLLRQESANCRHYGRLHPDELSIENRKKCLFNLKDIGYQVGSGFMVGSPFQTTDHIIEDLRFLQTLQPDMIGIGPYITHKDTPFCKFNSGSMVKTLRLISILRLMFPYALIPSTTALGTINPEGRELGLKCGANVVMPNLSPQSTRKLYNLYDNKICTGEEAAESVALLKKQVENAGYRVVTARGDAKRKD